MAFRRKGTVVDVAVSLKTVDKSSVIIIVIITMIIIIIRHPVYTVEQYRRCHECEIILHYTSNNSSRNNSGGVHRGRLSSG